MYLNTNRNTNILVDIIVGIYFYLLIHISKNQVGTAYYRAKSHYYYYY